MMSTNYTYTTIATSSGDEAGIAGAAGLRLLGVSVRETAASAATINIEHGTANSSPIMIPINVAASDSKSVWFGPQGLPCPNGVWLERLSGSTLVTLITTIA